ncbi:hypothetical protein ATANTOWER_019760 [Ataeniobius toweri]|uniref:Uncharacterized protein n=1 Tax=Ataeniobius toweri TaxID=208326 RepID=A0ABU7C6Y7_9TELE|nr:hypothetical protein [Ataeniobius toweri]
MLPPFPRIVSPSQSQEGSSKFPSDSTKAFGTTPSLVCFIFNLHPTNYLYTTVLSSLPELKWKFVLTRACQNGTFVVVSYPKGKAPLDTNRIDRHAEDNWEDFFSYGAGMARWPLTWGRRGERQQLDLVEVTVGFLTNSGSYLCTFP